MTQSTDTLNLLQPPFYQWDSTAYDLEADAPSIGVAVDSAYSIYMVHDTPVERDSVVRPSLFTGHELPVRSSAVTPRVDAAPQAWVFVLVMFLAAMTTLYYRQRKIRLGEMFHALIDSRAMDRMLRNNNLTRSSQLAPMGLLLVVTAALAIHQLAMAHTGWVGYLLLSAALALGYYLRNGLIRLLATIFDDNAAVGFYIASNYLYHLILATATLPLLLLILYMPFGHTAFVYSLAALVAVEFVMRLVRGLKLFLTQSSGSHFYLFYYLCIVEIAPILLITKWLIE